MTPSSQARPPRAHSTTPTTPDDVLPGDTLPVVLNGERVFARCTDVRPNTLRIDLLGIAHTLMLATGAVRPVKVKVTLCAGCSNVVCTCTPEVK